MKHPVPAVISQVKTMSRYVRVVFDTQETLSGDEKAELFDLYDKPGWLYFLQAPDSEVKTTNLPDIQLEEGEKSPSQRLRASLFVWWKQNRVGVTDCEIFYWQQ